MDATDDAGGRQRLPREPSHDWRRGRRRRGGGGGRRSSWRGCSDSPTEGPTRWTDQTALNIADDGSTEDDETADERGGAAFVAALALAAGVSAAFSFFSRVAVAAAAAPPPAPSPSDTSARARSSSASFHVGYERARTEQNTWHNFLIDTCIVRTGPMLSAPHFPRTPDQATRRVCSALEQLL